MHTPACCTVNVELALEVALAIVMVPDRGIEDGFARMDRETDPFDVPLATDVILTHGLLLTADHWHPAPAVMLKVVEAVEEDVEKLVGLIDKLQLACVGT